MVSKRKFIRENLFAYCAAIPVWVHHCQRWSTIFMVSDRSSDHTIRLASHRSFNLECFTATRLPTNCHTLIGKRQFATGKSQTSSYVECLDTPPEPSDSLWFDQMKPSISTVCRYPRSPKNSPEFLRFFRTNFGSIWACFRHVLPQIPPPTL